MKVAALNVFIPISIHLRGSRSCSLSCTTGCTNMLTESHNRAVCTDWWEPCQRGKETTERECVFHFGFHDRRSWAQGHGLMLQQQCFLWWLWERACPLFDGKSILVCSLFCLLSSSRAEIQPPLTGCVHPTPAVTLCNRNQSPDGGKKKSQVSLLTSAFTLMTLLMTSLTTLLQKLCAASSSTVPFFLKHLASRAGEMPD